MITNKNNNINKNILPDRGNAVVYVMWHNGRGKIERDIGPGFQNFQGGKKVPARHFSVEKKVTAPCFFPKKSSFPVFSCQKKSLPHLFLAKKSPRPSHRTIKKSLCPSFAVRKKSLPVCWKINQQAKIVGRHDIWYMCS